MKLSTTLIGLSMAFGTLTIAAPARPPPPTTIQSIKDCGTLDCLENCNGEYPCWSLVDLDISDNATTADPLNTTTIQPIKDCMTDNCLEECYPPMACACTGDLDPRDNTTTDISNTARDVAAQDVEAKAEEKLETKGKKWDWCVLFFNPFTDCL